ncbi:MAG: UTRA domain-containing protein [Stappiaceae bacterium]
MDARIKNRSNDKKSEAHSLHHRILNEVQENIVSGKWPPGFRIPFETEMAKEYGCSRMTVNKALTQLTRAGLLVRHRRSGTFVKAPQSLSAALEITNIRKEVEDSGKEYSYALMKDVVRDCAEADFERLEQKPASKVREMICLHSANGTPFCYEERIINMDAVPEIEDVSFDLESAGAWMLDRVPWNSAEHQIIACAASDTVADALDIAPGTACLVVERRTQNDLGYVTWAKLSYAGDNHRLFATFTPTG